MTTQRLATAVAALLFAAILSGCGDGDETLVEEVRAAWESEWNGSYLVTDFTTGGKASHVRVVTQLGDHPAPELRGEQYCSMAARLSPHVSRPWDTIDVIESDGGRVIAECVPSP